MVKHMMIYEFFDSTNDLYYTLKLGINYFFFELTVYLIIIIIIIILLC